MSKNWLYLAAVLTLPLIRVLVLNLHYDEWLRSIHYERGADFIVALRNNPRFGEFIGGWVFPSFIGLLLIYWIVEEDKSRIPMQFMLMPLAYVPFSMVGFTLVNAEFQVSYLYTNPLVILTFGYLYVLFWVAAIKLFEKLKIID